MAYDGTIPALSNLISNDIPAIQENFSLLESAQVVDEGSTADGDYIRYDNGWQVCKIYGATLSYGDSSYYSSVVNFPVSFINQEYIIVGSWRGFSGTSVLTKLNSLRVFSDGLSSSNIRYYINDNTLVSGDTLTVDLILIGRWK